MKKNSLLPFPVILLVLLIPGILQTSCSSTSMLSIDVLVPAEKNFPLARGKVTLVNRGIMSDSIPDSTPASRVYIDFQNQTSRECLIGLSDLLEDSPVVDSIHITDNGWLDSLNIIHPIPWDTLRESRDLRNPETVISLEFFDITAEQMGSMEPDASVLEDYMDNELYRLEVNIIIHSYWRVYDMVQQTIPDQYWTRDTLYLYGEGQNLEDAMAQLPNLEQAVLENAYWNGYDNGKRFVPYWLKADRFYYTRGSAGIRQGHELALQGRWMDAAGIWKEETHHKDDHVASMAMFNMAVAAEINDELEAALDWVTQSYYRYPSQSAKKYIELLNNRIAERKRLREQF